MLSPEIRRYGSDRLVGIGAITRCLPQNQRKETKMEFISAFIIGLVVSGIVYGIRHMIWKEEIPETISKL